MIGLRGKPDQRVLHLLFFFRLSRGYPSSASRFSLEENARRLETV